MDFERAIGEHPDLVDDFLQERPPPVAVELGEPPPSLGTQALDGVGPVLAAVPGDLLLGHPQLLAETAPPRCQLPQLGLNDVAGAS